MLCTLVVSASVEGAVLVGAEPSHLTGLSLTYEGKEQDWNHTGEIV